MKRALLALAASFIACAAQAGDRYGPSRPELRGPAGTAKAQRLLSWPGKNVALRGRTEAAPLAKARDLPPSTPAAHPEPKPAPAAPALASLGAPAPATAPHTFATPARSTAQPGYSPQIPRRYSVGREFGIAPDPIAMPAPSVLAFSPEVGAAFAASNARAAQEVSLNSADLDQIAQAEQDDARRETRQKARDRAVAAKHAD